MKITKVLLSAALLSSALAFTSCGGSPDAGSGSGNQDVGPLHITNGGKTLEINYTNNTSETQEYFVFAGENLGYDKTVNFTFYDDVEETNYTLGFFFDYAMGALKPEWQFLKFNQKSLNKVDFTIGVNDNLLTEDKLTKFDYSSLDTARYYFKQDANLYYEDGISTSRFAIEDRTNYTYMVLTLNGQYSFTNSFYVGYRDYSQFGYYLSVEPGKKVHLKLEIVDGLPN